MIQLIHIYDFFNMNGEVFKILRQFNGYRSADMADLLGISQGYVSEIENNKKNVSMELFEKYAEAFNMKPSTLMLFAESLDEENSVSYKLRVAHYGMKLLQLLEQTGELNDETLSHI